MANPTPLSLAEAQAQQALAEGFQDGPTPALNPANLFTQNVELNNPLTSPPSPPYFPIDNFPPATEVTPNLMLSLQGMDLIVAENFVIIDAALSGLPVALSTSAFFRSAGHQQPAIAAVAFEPAVTTANHVNAHLFYLPGQVTVNIIKMYVGVGQPGATLNAGIYSNSGVLLIDSGAMAASGSGVVVTAANQAIGVTLAPGWYYFAFSSNNTVATFLTMNQNNIAAYYTLIGGQPRTVIAATNASGGALPSTLGVIPTLSAADVVYHPLILFSQD
jgi:hypothetical protein